MNGWVLVFVLAMPDGGAVTEHLHGYAHRADVVAECASMRLFDRIRRCEPVSEEIDNRRRKRERN